MGSLYVRDGMLAVNKTFASSAQDCEFVLTPKPPRCFELRDREVCGNEQVRAAYDIENQLLLLAKLHKWSNNEERSRKMHLWRMDIIATMHTISLFKLEQCVKAADRLSLKHKVQSKSI